MKLAQWLRSILNVTFEANERTEFSGVTDLSAALSIEGRLVEDDGDGFALLGLVDARPVPDQRQDDAFAFVARIAGEFGCPDFLGKVVPKLVGRLLARPLPGGPSGGLLLGHRGIEA